MRKLKVILDGNEYCVVDEEDEQADWLVAYDRAVWGNECARKLAQTFIEGYTDGYRAACPISSDIARDG